MSWTTALHDIPFSCSKTVPLHFPWQLGKEAVAQVEAASRGEAISKVRNLGRLIICIDQVDAQADTPGVRAGTPAATVQFVGQITRFLAAGVTIEHALQMSRGEDEAGRLAESLRAAIRAGEPLPAAAARHPQAFDAVDVALIRAGESTGDLAGAFAEIERLALRRRHVRDRIRSAMVYPLILVAVAISSILMILLHVIPQFEPMVAETTVALPLPARMVFGLSNAVQSAGWIAGLVLLGCIVWLTRAALNGQLETTVMALARRAPFLRQVYAEFDIARVALLLGTLLSRNVPLVSAIDITRSAVNAPPLAASLWDIRRRLQDGTTLRTALLASEAFPDFLVRMVQVGEATGSVGPMLLRAAAIIDERVDHKMQRFVILSQPLILVIIGFIIGGLLYGLFSAILSINQTIL